MRTVDNPTFAANDGSLHKTIDAAATHDAKAIFESLLDGSGYEGAEGALAVKWQMAYGRLAELHKEVEAANEAERSRIEAAREARRVARAGDLVREGI
jgi:hypothetical protein